MVKISEIDIPDFGAPNAIPEIPAAVFEARRHQTLQRMREEGLDVLIVYADREHSANMAYLTGFDPRFEEALFILTADGQSTLCLGNECIHIVSDLPIQADVLLCQEFSLMGQDRSVSWDLKPLLAKAGLRTGMRCGIAGWKSLMAGRIEVPAYIADLVTEVCGSRPINANHVFMHPQLGLRITNEPEQIAFYEYAATQTSRSVLNVLRSLKPGRRCFELARGLDGGGLPLSCHPMLTCGQAIANGMASPGNDLVEQGHFLTCAFGVWGALTCRAGMVTDDPTYLRFGKGRETLRLIENYLLVTRAWYAALDVGVAAGDVFAAADEARDDTLYTFCVNTGHFIHLDEWVCSPFERDSTIPLRSGSAIQADIIPISRAGDSSVNMEDGLVLADENLRSTLSRRFPDMYARCQARRRFMTDLLGYELSDAVLPLGNMPGVYFPCLLNTRLVCQYE